MGVSSAVVVGRSSRLLLSAALALVLVTTPGAAYLLLAHHEVTFDHPSDAQAANGQFTCDPPIRLLSGNDFDAEGADDGQCRSAAQGRVGLAFVLLALAPALALGSFVWRKAAPMADPRGD